MRYIRDLEVLLREVVQKLNNMTEGTFWCLFKCLGGIGAVGLGGILALVGLVYALPVAGFTAAGITAGSLAAKIVIVRWVRASWKSICNISITWRCGLRPQA